MKKLMSLLLMLILAVSVVVVDDPNDREDDFPRIMNQQIVQ